jgi:nucleoid-associated protein YgaU
VVVPVADAVTPPPAWAQPFASGEGATTWTSAQSGETSAAQPPADAPAAGTAQTPAAAALAVGVVEKDGDTVTVSGASLPGATVRVYVNDTPVGEAVADAAGRWTFTGPHAVGPGDHTVRADQIDPATGTVMARSAVPFEVLSAAEIADAPATAETPAVALPAPTAAETAMIAEPAVEATGGAEAAGGTQDAEAAAGAGMRKIRIRKGDDLWTLAERYYGKRRGVRYTAIYRANRKQIRDPDLIYPGQVFIIPR